MTGGRRPLTWRTVAALIALGMLAGSGCVHTTQVRPLGGSGGVVLDADDVVHLMLRAGFEEERILELGPDLRDALAHGGTARIEKDNQVEAIFSVSGTEVYVSTRAHGNFVYDTGSKSFQ
jgi:hypothetical protein